MVWSVLSVRRLFSVNSHQIDIKQLLALIVGVVMQRGWPNEGNVTADLFLNATEKWLGFVVSFIQTFRELQLRGVQQLTSVLVAMVLFRQLSD